MIQMKMMNLIYCIVCIHWSNDTSSESHFLFFFWGHLLSCFRASSLLDSFFSVIRYRLQWFLYINVTQNMQRSKVDSDKYLEELNEVSWFFFVQLDAFIWSKCLNTVQEDEGRILIVIWADLTKSIITPPCRSTTIVLYFFIVFVSTVTACV